MSFYLPPAIHLLFRSFLVRRPQYLMLPMTELQLFYSEKVCGQNGWPAGSRRPYSKKDRYYILQYCWFSWAGRLLLTPAAQR